MYGLVILSCIIPEITFGATVQRNTRTPVATRSSATSKTGTTSASKTTTKKSTTQKKTVAPVQVEE